MKKNFISVAKMFLFGIVATVSASLASCSDDTAYDSTTAQNVLEMTASNELEGAFTGSTQDGQLNMVVKGSNMKMSTSDGTAEAKVTYDSSQKTYKGEFTSPFNKIKNFEFKKFGTFYYGLDAQMTDGTQQEFAFYKSTSTRAGNKSNPDYNTEYLKGVMQAGIDVLGDLHPAVKLILCPFANLLVNGVPEEDMSVQDCYDKLDQSLSQISLQITEFERKYSQATSLGWLKDHNMRRSTLEVPTRQILSKIVSLKQENSADADAQIQEEVKKWGERYADVARNYIDDVYQGTPLFTPYSKIIDDYAETIFPWEHQGYDIREKYRLHQLNIVAEVATMMKLNFDIDYTQVDNNLGAKLEHIVEVYNANKVVRDNDHAICQIEGANHIKISKNSFGAAMTSYPGRDNKIVSIFNIPEGKSLNDDLGFLVVPIVNKTKDYEDNADFKKWKEKMMTTSEAEAIMKYYGNSRSMFNILLNEAKLNRPGTTDNDSFLLLYGSTTSLSNKKNEGYAGNTSGMWGTMDVWGTVDVTLDKVCYVNRTANAFDSFYLGKAKWNYHEVAFRDRVDYFNGWKDLHTTTKAMRLTVDEREDKWLPGHYLNTKQSKDN